MFYVYLWSKISYVVIVDLISYTSIIIIIIFLKKIKNKNLLAKIHGQVSQFIL